jgi:acetyl-CoA acetyltransferase
MSMGEHTEITVKEWGISRAEQDEIAFRSHMNAAAATDDDRLTAEIHPLARLNPDPIIRPGTSMERLAQLSPVFDKSAHGTLTAGNSSPLTDGASATVLMSESAAKAHGFTPLAYVKAIEFAAIHPDDGLLMGPGVAVPRLLRRVRLDLDDIDIIEMHEAFGGQVASNLAAWEHGGRMSRSGMWTATSSTLKGGRSPSATPSPPPDLASSTNSPTRWNVVTPVSGW